MEDMKAKRAKFIKIFSNIPEKIRNEDIIAIVEGKPYTWSNAYFEIKEDTELGRKILKVLIDLKII